MSALFKVAPDRGRARTCVSKKRVARGCILLLVVYVGHFCPEARHGICGSLGRNPHLAACKSASKTFRSPRRSCGARTSTRTVVFPVCGQFKRAPWHAASRPHGATAHFFFFFCGTSALPAVPENDSVSAAELTRRRRVNYCTLQPVQIAKWAHVEASSL